MIKFPNFEAYIRQHVILDRGMNVYNDDRVVDIVSTGNNKWQADVTSESDSSTEYSVKITIKDHKVTYHRCDCPFRFGPICKHRVAVLFEIRDRDLYESEGESNSDESQSLDSVSMDDDEVVDESSSSEEVIVKPKKKETKKKKVLPKGAPVLPSMFDNDDDDILGPSLIKKEMECQVCLSSLTKPVSLPCQSHSICYDCMKTLLDKQPKSRGAKTLMCPTCGRTGGEMKVKSKKDLKVNKEIERIKSTYEQERTKMIEERVKLALEIEGLKTQNTQKVLDKLEVSTESSTPIHKDNDIENQVLGLTTNEMEKLFLSMYEKLKSKGEYKAINKIKEADPYEDLIRGPPKTNGRRKESPVDFEKEFVQARSIVDSNLDPDTKQKGPSLEEQTKRALRILKKSKK